MPSKEQSPLSLPIKLLLPRERVERRIVGGLELFRTQPRQISGIGAAYLYGDRGDTYYTEEAFCFKDQQLQVRSARELDRNGWFALQLHVAGAKEFVRSVMALPGNIRLDAAMQFNPDYEEENPLLATGYFAYEWSYEGSEGRMFFIPPDIHTLADFDFHFGMK